MAPHEFAAVRFGQTFLNRPQGSITFHFSLFTFFPCTEIGIIHKYFFLAVFILHG